ncbi:MAG: hypothetical protein QXJ74_05885 [Nitrososphaera sp.]|nr:hypothetical protein [Nitrososphaera sp.]
MEDEQCCMCDSPAQIFQDDRSYCLECWQETTTPNIQVEFYN